MKGKKGKAELVDLILAQLAGASAEECAAIIERIRARADKWIEVAELLEEVQEGEEEPPR